MPKRVVPAIEGARVRLRPLTQDDLRQTLAWRNRDENRRWFLHADPLTWEQHERWFRGYIERDDDFVFIIEDAGAADRAIGQVALYRLDWGAGTAEFGRLLIGGPEGRGRGLGREATEALVAFGFENWGLQRIDLEVLKDNDRAIQIYRHLGFEEARGPEGPLRMTLTRPAWEDGGRVQLRPAHAGD